MAYTTINKSTDYFNTVTYTGNGSSQSITGVGHQPDFTWIKSRSSTAFHLLTDAVRGVTKQLYSNSTTAENTNSYHITSFNSDGFSVGSAGDVNGNGTNFVSWNWKANGAGSTNYDGTITSTVSANQTAGFSLVKWTGNGTAGATVGHGLGSEMKMMILKDYSLSRSWITYHTYLGGGSGINFSETGVAGTNSGYWNNVAPTSSVFSTGTYSNENNSDYICYCFAEVPGYSKFGSYTGNGNADGTFVYTGFKPAFVIVRQTNGINNWQIHDSKRPGYNVTDYRLYANLNSTEDTGNSYGMDLLSNGFKLRTSDGGWNSSNPYIYMAFGQSLVGSNNVPCTAR